MPAAQALIVREHRQAWARHERVNVLTGRVLAIVVLGRVGGHLELALGADAVAVAVIGERWRLI